MTFFQDVEGYSLRPLVTLMLSVMILCDNVALPRFLSILHRQSSSVWERYSQHDFTLSSDSEERIKDGQVSDLHKLIQLCESRAQQARQEARIRQEAEARARAEATRSQEERRRRDKERLTPTTAEGETTSHTTTQVHRFHMVGLYANMVGCFTKHMHICCDIYQCL